MSAPACFRGIRQCAGPCYKTRNHAHNGPLALKRLDATRKLRDWNSRQCVSVRRTETLHDRLAAIKAFSKSAFGLCFHPPDSKNGAKRIFGKPWLAGLGVERTQNVRDLTLAKRLIETHEEIGCSPIAIVLRNFIFEDQVIPEGVPRQLRNQPVILMEIVAMVSEDEIGLKIALDRLHEFLDGPPLVREKTVAKASNYNARPSRCLEKQPRGLAGFSFSLRRGTENDPVELEIGIFPRQAKNRAAATDLNIVAVRAKTQNLANSSLCIAQAQIKHAGCRREPCGPFDRGGHCWGVAGFRTDPRSSKLPTGRGPTLGVLPAFGDP